MAGQARSALDDRKAPNGGIGVIYLCIYICICIVCVCVLVVSLGSEFVIMHLYNFTEDSSFHVMIESVKLISNLN